MSARVRMGARVLLAFAAVVLGPAGPAIAAAKVTLSGEQIRGPLTPDAQGRFGFGQVPLRKNAVNRFTVTATDDAGKSVSKDVAITQISLESVVVSQIKSERLSVQEVEQLVQDGVIDVEDPANYNVSSFAIVLSIGGQPVPVSVPIVMEKGEDPTGYETIKLPRGDDGGGPINPPEVQVVVFETEPPAPPGAPPPPKITGVLVIEGDIKTLKEFFSVRLLLLNTSGIFTLSDVKGMLEFPDGGLSPTLPKDGVAVFGDILPGTADAPGQKEREFIVRGDEIGRRRARVSFGGVVTGPGIEADAPIPFNGSAETTLEVKGPPTFDVRVFHPPSVTTHVPYTLQVEITNTGDIAALYSSLDLGVGADGRLLHCTVPEGETEPVCEPIESGSETRALGHLLPGQRVRESFVIEPLLSGPITSCTSAADQNIRLQVYVGNLGCVTGLLPARSSSPDGVPTVAVVPAPGALGVGVDAPVTAFFSEKMNTSTITTGGEGASFRVLDESGAEAPGRLRFATVLDRTVAIWQLEDGVTNRLRGNETYRVKLSGAIRDQDGVGLAGAWDSDFTTTDPNDDRTPPTLTLSVEPPVDPLRVVPGEIVRVNAYAADQGTGVKRVELRLQDVSVPDSPVELVDQKAVFAAATEPLLFAIDSSKLAAGHTIQIIATAFDGALNLQDATLPIVLRSANVPPAIVLPPDPAGAVLQGISVTIVPEQASAGVKRVHYFLDGETAPWKTVELPPFQATRGTLDLSLGAHEVRAVAEDGLGQTAEDRYGFTLAENPSEPVIDFGSAVDGTRLLRGTRFAVGANASDAVGIASLQFYLDSVAGTPIAAGAQGFTLETADLTAGTHRIIAVAENRLGTRNDVTDPASILDFVVIEPGTGPPPPPPAIASVSVPEAGPGGATEVTLRGATSAGARVDVTNAASGVSISVYADATGAFTARIFAAAGDSLRVVVVDLVQSQQPSAAATAVVPAPRVLSSLRLLPSALVFVSKNAAQDLTATGFYADGSSENVTAQAAYASSDPTVASVSAGGRVVALRRGLATITATLGGLSDTAAVTADIVTLESVSVSPASITLPAPGATQALAVSGHYSDGSVAPVTSGLSFSSSAPAVIGVDPGGVVRAVSIGSATISVSASGLPPVFVPATVDTAADQPPSIDLLAPAAGADVERGDAVSVVARGSDDVGVARIHLTVSGATSYTETRQMSPAATTTQQSFGFAIAADAAIGGSVVVSVEAEDTSGKRSPIASVTLDVVDVTPPVVAIQTPAPDAPYNFGDLVTVTVAASDAGGIAQIRYEASGALTMSSAQAVSPPQALAGASFGFTVPFGVTSPNVTLRAFARDAAGNESASAPVPIVLTDADVTPPATIATAASAPGSGATTSVSYAVTDGLADLDHVELFFRRNGIGTFSRYTGPLGTGDGHFAPQSGATGTIAFDATRMGGDGSYEFFTVGVDRAGNREAPPRSGGVIAGDPGVGASFATGAEVVAITSDTEIAGAAFEGRNLRVVGATLTLVGPHAFGNVELLSGAVLTHRETTQTEAYGVELSAWTLTVDASSRVDVTGRGYLGGDRSGLGSTAHTAGFAPGSQGGTGGGYGGLGGKYGGSGSAQPNPVYGSLTNPVDLGSGGGAWAGAGGDGGGRVLVGAINVVVDGQIAANGAVSSGSASGEGSGGSINVTTRTLSGGGTLAANAGTTGGGNHVGGGGGRIAVRYLDVSTYDVARVTARGGDGYYGDGADGTIYLEAEGQPAGELVINGAGPGSPFTDLILPPGQSFSSITLQNGANVIAQGAIDITGTLRVRGSSTLTHPTASEAGLSITADRIVVEAGSAIDASGRGHLGGDKTSFGSTADTLGFTAGSERGSGGSHGGTGGDYGGNGDSGPGPVYGDPKRPIALGGGGGAWGGAGGDGGGRIRIVAREALVVDGAVRANGGLSSGSASGEGAGGSIWIDTSRLAGTGTISASGGTAGGGNHTGGGGGRIAIYADFVDPNANLGELRSIVAFGGDGYYGDGAAGTVFVKLAGQTDGTLIVDGGLSNGGTWPIPTVLPPIGPGVTAAATSDTLTVDGALHAFIPGGLVGLRLNPDTTQAESFAIVGNTASALQVATPNENGVAFAPVAGAGRRYAGRWRFDEVVLRRGGHLELADPLETNGSLAVTEASLLTHVETTTAYAGMLDLAAATLHVDATSRIDVSGRGHLGGDRAGIGSTAHTIGFAAGSQAGTGGSYGGLGGKYGGSGASQPNPPYGSVTDPQELGSGGGAWGGDGGDGGGRVRIVADSMIVDGALRADGAASSGSASGEGSGGSINLRVGTLAGAGWITANGGTANGGNHTGGGGGRIAIRHTGSLTLPLANVRATGGDGYYADGGHGTVYVKSTAQTFGSLVVDGYGFAQPADSTTLPGGLQLDELTLGSGVRAVADAGLDVLGTLRLAGGATLTHSPANEFGLRVSARRIVVEAGSAIDATGRGYRGGDKSGIGSTAHTLGFAAGSERGTGGSHGGTGGDWSGNGDSVPGAVYGDPKRPAALGGGGGAWSGEGGDGGGLVRLHASESLVVDGAVRADGGVSGGSASGEGAGGSVWIDTPLLSGAGTISANGGTANGGNHTGGGGGRVAVHAGAIDPGADFAGLRGITAFGGDGYYGDGAAGTVFVKLAGQSDGTLYVDGGAAPGTTWPMATALPPIGPGLAVAATADTLTASGTLRAFVPGGLVGLRLNPDTTQRESFEIVANGETSITVATPNENGVAFESLAAAGRRYAAAWRFDQVTFRRGAFLELADPLAVAGTLAVAEAGLLTHAKTTTVYEGDLDLDAGAVTIDASSRIDVSGRGYLGGDKAGLGSTAHTLGFASGAQAATGGSYGGLGGKWSGSGANQPNPVYGSATEPRELGSGGGAWSGAGGDGGGRVRIVAGAVVVDGAIRADGALSGGSASGEGSGGSIDLRTGTLAGSGTVSASGGTTGGGNHTGGGGGRIAIRHTSVSTLPPANVHADGGDGYYGDGQPGTVLLEGP